jgi:xanthine/uracil permease
LAILETTGIKMTSQLGDLDQQIETLKKIVQTKVTEEVRKMFHFKEELRKALFEGFLAGTLIGIVIGYLLKGERERERLIKAVKSGIAEIKKMTKK